MKVRQLSTGLKEQEVQHKANLKLQKRKISWIPSFSVLCTLLALWVLGPVLLQSYDQTAGSVDQSVWLLVVLGLICFLLVLNLCWWVFKNVWKGLGFPDLHLMVSQFNLLSPWQQLGFFWASFALVLLAALGSLSAVL